MHDYCQPIHSLHSICWSKYFLKDFFSLVNFYTFSAISFIWITTRQRSYGKVTFSVVSVSHSVRRGCHVTITHNTLNLTVQKHSIPRSIPPLDMAPHCTENPWPQPPPGHETSLYRDSSPLPVLTSGDNPRGSPGHGTSLYRALRPIHPFLTSTDIWWPRLKICSNLFTWGPDPQVLTFGGS